MALSDDAVGGLPTINTAVWVRDMSPEPEGEDSKCKPKHCAKHNGSASYSTTNTQPKPPPRSQTLPQPLQLGPYQNNFMSSAHLPSPTSAYPHYPYYPLHRLGTLSILLAHLPLPGSNLQTPITCKQLLILLLSIHSQNDTAELWLPNATSCCSPQ